MDRQELVRNAIDANGFKSTDTSAGYINPDFWNKQLLSFVQENIVVAGYAKVYNDLLGGAGDTLNITVGAVPTAASALTESVDVPIDALSLTQVVFSPTEYGAAYQLSDKEARRGIFDVASEITTNLSYRLAYKRELFAINLLQTSAGNAVTANGVVSSAIAASDTIDYIDVVSGRTKIRQAKLIPYVMFVSSGQMGHLLKDTQFSYAERYGGREGVLGGEVRKIAGMIVEEATAIAAASSKSKAIVLGKDIMGNAPFGIAMKLNPYIRSQRWERGRYTDFVAVEEWDMKCLRTTGICTIESYDA